jgi:hypothetical protein
MKTRFFFIFYLCLPFYGYTQTVINTEEMRLRDNEKNFVGLFNFSFGMTENKADRFIKPNADLRLEWAKERDRVIGLGGYQLTRFSDLDNPDTAPRNFTHKSFAHLRYNRQASERLTWEAFTQYQFDEVQEIDQRYLLGTGPRWQIAKSDSAFIFFGMMYMYEYEQTSAREIELNRHHRLSTYLSAGIQFNENVGLNNTTYYQPRPDLWSDFRISTVSQLFTRISKQLSITINVSLVYDSRPPETVPLRMFDMTAGFSYQL